MVKRIDVFLVKEFGNGNQMVQFSKEPNNKHFGLATANTISVQAGKDSGVVLATIKTNKQKYPSALVHKTVINLGNISRLLVPLKFSVKAKLSERVLELLVLPGDDVPRLLLDISKFMLWLWTKRRNII
ncbi:60S ribosomal protein L28-2-like isoform X1 [Papaver somniferum]|uniref:60S ribosomal protein L28-2-like isoform X1 n=1 Tax=Papaver somniferum TaxID=3469 RepID=UPI000E6FF672|nr:60S ribosomal protein L28-2-like isoform X1 [Papaver somniferum]